MEAGNASSGPRGGDRRVRARLGAIGRFLPSRRADDDDLALEPEPALVKNAPAVEEIVGAEAPVTSETAVKSTHESPFLVALGAAAIAIVLLGGLAYFAAREFTGRAADSRASEEAVSFASHSSTLATGDAFAGYLQILRYADDDVVRAKIATREQREAVLQQQVYLNTNKMQVLAVADRQGLVIAAVGLADLTTLQNSEAFLRTRSSVGPANSDILIPEGAPPYIEYATPLTDPGDGSIWGVLYGRANPDILWRGTIGASIDGSRNVILNQKGQFAAGVPQGLIGQPWGGTLLDNGGVRADIAGVDSICGLGAIAQTTQIDRGWAVASCLPASLIQVEASNAMGQLGLVVIAGCVLGIVLVAVLLRFALPRGGGAASAAAVTDDADEVQPEFDTDAMPGAAELVAVPDVAAGVGAPATTQDELTDVPDVEAEPEPESEPEPIAPVVTTVVVPDVDAVALIAAFEDRSARMAEQIRERLQAPLMIAASQAEAAFAQALAAAEGGELPSDADEDPPTDAADQPDLSGARRLHAIAILELETLRERALRSVTEELFPAPVQLGLPAALGALPRAFPGLALNVETASEADSKDGTGGRAVVDDARRLIVYRTARESLQLAQAAGADGADVTLARVGDELELRVLIDGASIDADGLRACAVAAEAYGGALALDGHAVLLTIPAPSIGAAVNDATPPLYDEDADEAEAFEDAELEAPARIITFPAPIEAAVGAFRAALDEAALAVEGVDVTIDVDAALEEEGVLEPELAGALRTIAGASLQAASGGTSGRATLWVRRLRDHVLATITLDGVAESAVGSPAFDAARSVIEGRGGTVTVAAVEAGCVVSVEAPAAAPVVDDDVVVVKVEPAASADEEPAA